MSLHPNSHAYKIKVQALKKARAVLKRRRRENGTAVKHDAGKAKEFMIALLDEASFLRDENARLRAKLQAVQEALES